MKNIFLAILSGIFLAIAWPTYGFPIFLFIGFVPLLFAEYKIRTSKTKNSKLKVLGNAYLTFIIYNFFTTGWLFYATPFGMFFANMANSLLMSLLFLIYHIFSKKTGRVQSLIFLTALWIGFEKFHLNWEFSWPWLNLGNGFANHYKWVQWYEYTGTFGGTLWVWTVNNIVFTGLINWKKTQNKRQFVKSIILAVSIVIIGIFSSLYLYHKSEEASEEISVIVLQPNIDPYTEKYNTSNMLMAKDIVQLAETKIDSAVDFIIAPETALPKPSLIKTFKETLEYKTLKNFIAKYPESSLLCGITFINIYPPSKTPNKTANFYINSKQWYNIFNSSFYLKQSGNFDVYHKSKLVVGVEHIPYRNILSPILKNYMIDLGGHVSTLSTQKNRALFSNNKNKLAPIICYESVYGEYVTGYVKKGADFLAIITNDGWWSTSQGYKQHLSIARLRAIETRRSIARSANTGVSALINQKGDIIQFIPYGKKGALKGKIKVNKTKTYYTIHGDFIYRISMFVQVLLILIYFTNNKKTHI